MKKSILFLSTAFCLLATLGTAPAANKPSIARDPYIGAIVVDANSGEVLREDRPGAPGYPASMVKMMNLFVTLDAVKEGRVSLSDVVRVSTRAANWGGSQVWLDPKESFPLDELLYAMVIHSANDAAFLVAEHVAGSGESFVTLMNAKAKALGLSPVTHFVTPHGLPPSSGRPDITTAADYAKLCTALLRDHPETLNYTSVEYRTFRNGTFDLRNRNPLIGSFPGCDGLKTGYFSAAGFSTAVTAERDGRRAIAVILGSPSKATRDAQARSWLEFGLSHAKPKAAEPPPVAAQEVAPSQDASPDLSAAPADDESAAPGEEPAPAPKKGSWGKVVAWLVAILAVGWIALRAVKRRLLVSRQANVHVRK